jgi:hypothetical protein
MRVRAALVAFGIAVLSGAGTAYADGAPVAGVSVGGGGVTWGGLRYVAVPASKGTAVAQIDRATGAVSGFVALKGAWGIPQVAYDGSTAGISAGGQTLVLGQNAQAFPPRRSRFALLDPVNMRVERIVTLTGAFFFDAISPDGSTMYLIELTSPRNIQRYAVRAYDLRSDRLVPGAIVDKAEPDERMAGFPVSRAATADGRWAYTLYQKPMGALFIHALDTQAGVAHCVDLPPLTAVSQDMMRLSLDGGRVDVRSGGQVLAAVDRVTLRVTRSPAPEPSTAAPRPTPKPDRPNGSDRTALAAGGIAAVVLLAAVGAALAVRRRRPARGGRSGGAAAGAPSGP